MPEGCHIKIRLISAAIFIVIFGTFPQGGFAANIEDLRKEIEARNEEIKKLEEEAEKYRQEIVTRQELSKTLKEELARIERTVAQLKREITITEKKIQKAELELENLNLEIKEKEISIRRLKGGLAEIIQTVFEKEQESLLETILKYRFLNQLFKELDYLAALQKKALGSLDILRTLQKELGEKKDTTETKKGELEDLRGLLAARRAIQTRERNARNTLLSATRQQEKKYQELLRDREKRRAALEQEVREIEEQIRVAIDPSLLPAKGTGVLGWPLPEISLKSCFSGLAELKNCVTQFFGYTSFAAVGGYSGKGHNGVDFRASIGTQVLAAADGEVLGVGDTDTGCAGASYGKWVLINHRNHISTLYAHLASIEVIKGQSVRRGERIALSGSTGYATGPHLHLGAMITEAVEIKTIKSIVCGRNMTIPAVGRDSVSGIDGYLNPLDYL